MVERLQLCRTRENRAPQTLRGTSAIKQRGSAKKIGEFNKTKSSCRRRRARACKKKRSSKRLVRSYSSIFLISNSWQTKSDPCSRLTKVILASMSLTFPIKVRLLRRVPQGRATYFVVRVVSLSSTYRAQLFRTGLESRKIINLKGHKVAMTLHNSNRL